MTRLLSRLRFALGVGAVVGLLVGVPANGVSRAQFPIESVGDRGADVTALQHLLRASGHRVPATGYFGDRTRRALMAFQRSSGLAASGIAHVSTWEKIVPDLSMGASGEAVLALKGELNAKHGAGLSTTPTFDSATRNAVRALQREMNLPATGVVDRNTWRKLTWHFMRPDFARASLCNYNGGHRNADWGTANAIAQLESAADLFRSRAGGVVAIGDISFKHGGDIDLHQTHEDGLDIDIALIRTDGRQCTNPGISYKSSKYDRDATRQMLQAIHDDLWGHLQLIYFNDPQMIRAGLSQRYPNHDDHIHVRLCVVAHALARYDC